MNLTKIQQQFHDNADDIINKQSWDTKEQDRINIIHIRHRMRTVPIGEALLNWADENDIKIVIDHETKAGGYYHNGLKFIGISSHSNMSSSSVLAHEIIHAIQDAYGLLNNIDNATLAELNKHSMQDYLNQTHFTEAAAFAVGDYVGKEVKKYINHELTTATNKSEPKPKRNFDIKEAKKDLEDRFINYFRKKHTPQNYEDRHLKIYAKTLGIKNIPIPNSHTEYDMPKTINKVPYNHGVDLNNETETRKIGDVLGILNFLDELPKDFNRSAQFRKLTTDFSLGADFIPNSRWQELQEEKRIKQAKLFKQVKHLQKQL